MKGNFEFQDSFTVIRFYNSNKQKLFLSSKHFDKSVHSFETVRGNLTDFQI